MRIKIVFAIALFLGFCIFADAGDKGRAGMDRPLAYNGFIGGMMIHSGYVWSKNASFVLPGGQGGQTVKAEGVPAGIGGAIKLMFGKHLRVGGEGYVSTLTYGKYRSHASTGFGGLLAECAWTLGKWKVFAGGLAGGGSVRNITLLSDAGTDFVIEDRTVSYRKYGFLAVAPYAGVEYAVNRKISIVVKVDYIVNVSNPQDDFITGPRLFLGFMFGHSH